MKAFIERDLVEGEDLMEFAGKLQSAVENSAHVFGASSEDIYIEKGTKSEVIVFDFVKERYVKAQYTRDGDEFIFTSPVVVKQVFEEVGGLESVQRQTGKDLMEIVIVPIKKENFWGGVL